MSTSDLLAAAALLVAFASIIQTAYLFRRSFRPIVTAMVRSSGGGNEAIAYSLVVQNSGSIPARNVTLHIHDRTKLEAALDYALDADREIFLRCFSPDTVIPILQNGSEVSCSFGFTRRNNSFWHPGAKFEIWLRYEGWLGRVFVGPQILEISDSKNFTKSAWLI